jgi:hypothetical protein
MATLCVELRRSARAPLVAQTSVCVLFSASTQIKTTQAEACATGLPQNSREKCALAIDERARLAYGLLTDGIEIVNFDSSIARVIL